MTKIEWAQETWNPILGCSKYGSGCRHCYAIKHVNRLAGNPKFGEVYQGLVQYRNGVLNWTGIVRLNPARLDLPERTKKQTIWFVNSLSDLFHESLAVIPVMQDAVFDRMERAPWHHYLVLTKRPAGAVEYFRLTGLRARYLALPFIHFGISASKQDELNAAAPWLYEIGQSGMSFLSLEPLLGPVDPGPVLATGKVHWVITGAESNGFKAGRPCQTDWVRVIRDRCQQYGVPFFYKQDYVEGIKVSTPSLDGRRWTELPWQLSGVRGVTAA